MNNTNLFFATDINIIDFGSGTVKAGLSNQEEPSVVFDSIIGHPKFKQVVQDISNRKEDTVVGPSADQRGLYKLENAIHRGVITSKTNAELLINKIYNETKIHANKDIPVFICEPPFTPKRQKRELAELFFEEKEVQRLFFGTQGVLSLYGVGQKLGLVLESGEGITQVVPVYNGYKLEQAVERIDFGGCDVTNYLRLLMRKNGTYVNSTSESSILKDIKEGVTEFCQQSLGSDLKSAYEFLSTNEKYSDSLEVDYKLPDGSVVSIGPERFMAPEILFNPSIAGLEFPGLHEFVNSSIKRLDIDLRKKLYQNIILSGGNTLLNGFNTRFAKEMDQLVNNKQEVKIKVFNHNQSNFAWMGAYAISSQNSFQKMWIDKDEYNENGDRIFLSKQF